MKTYSITFTGRKKGAIGIFSKFNEKVEAKNAEYALLCLYDRYEHISLPVVAEIRSKK